VTGDDAIGRLSVDSDSVQVLSLARAAVPVA
jgi:hypothetical protein